MIVFRRVPKIAKKRLLDSSCVSVRQSTRNNSAGRIFMKCNIWVFFEKKLSKKFKFHSNRTRMKDTLKEDQRTFLSSLAQFFL